MSSPSTLLKKLYQENLAQMIMFADTIVKEPYIASVLEDKALFHEVLATAKDHNWITPMELSEMLPDYTLQHVRKLFLRDAAKRSTPKPIVIRTIIMVVGKLIKQKATELEQSGPQTLLKPVVDASVAVQ